MDMHEGNTMGGPDACVGPVVLHLVRGEVARDLEIHQGIVTVDGTLPELF